MKRALLTLLVTFLLAHAPWRLMVLAAEVLVVSRGHIHTDPGHDQYWQARDLETRLTSLGWTVTYRRALTVYGTEAYGVTQPSERAITIDADLSWNARLATLAHEGGHVLQPAWLDRNQGEAFAESVAALVAHDGLREHARYLASMRADFVIVVLVEWRAIYRAAYVLETVE